MFGDLLYNPTYVESSAVCAAMSAYFKISGGTFMKKFLSVVLALTLCFCIAAPIASAADTEEVYPIIIVPGYSSSALYKDGENGEQVHIWNIQMDKILTRIVVNAAELGIDIGALATGDAKKLADTVGVEFKMMFGDMAYDESGKPVTELHTYHSRAYDTNSKWLNENEDGEYRHEIEIMPYVTENLGDKAEEWTFNFNTDFRRNIVDCAADLDRYIDDVLDYTGASKVNLIAVSHGGQTTATYLALYGEKGKVNNAVMTVPAIGGALLAYDLITNSAKLDEQVLLQFIENGMMFEEDYNWLVKADELGFLDDVIYYLVPYVKDVLGCWGSIWDFMPAEKYEQMKKEYAPEALLGSEIIEKSDYFHNEILANMSSLLKKAENAGTNVYIIAGTGWPSVIGTQENSDAIISVNSSTGAVCAPYGSRFNDGYQTLGTICSDDAHNHLSPGMEIDASTAYLPETTWFCNGLFHGMTLKDDYSAELMKMLVETNDHVDVHSFAEYPQFHYSMNVCESVYAEFDTSTPGYITADDTALVITNLSKKNNMRLLSVAVEGMDISFDLSKYMLTEIKPRESITVKFSGKLPKESLTTAAIKVSYFMVGSVTPLNDKVFNFTVMNGKAKTYDSENPFVELSNESRFKEHISGSSQLTIFDKLGLTSLFEVIYDIIYNIIGKYILPIISRK